MKLLYCKLYLKMKNKNLKYYLFIFILECDGFYRYFCSVFLYIVYVKVFFLYIYDDELVDG